MIRSILELPARPSFKRIPRQIAGQQRSLYLSSRREFSTAAPQNASTGKPGKPPESGSSLPKFILGGIAVSAAFMAAYQSGYLDHMLGKEKHDSLETSRIGLDLKNQDANSQDAKSLHRFEEEKVLTGGEVLKDLSPQMSDGKKDDIQPVAPRSDALNESEIDVQSHSQDKSEFALGESNALSQLEESPTADMISNVESTDSAVSSERSHDTQSPMISGSKLPDEEVGQLSSQASSVTDLDETKVMPHQDLVAEERQEDASGHIIETPGSLLESYHLKDKSEERSPPSLNRDIDIEAFASAIEESNDGVATKDGKLILDFLQAIHVAEKRQAELDARHFAEEKRKMKEKYEKDLKDAIARDLMHAEEAALLDKELKRERAKAAAALAALQQKLEEKHILELEQKESEAEMKLKKVEELAKAEMVSAIAREKAAQIEKMAEANLHINALCMAFYARSEEARQSHSVHKLALGALALEDALSKGLPIKAEIEALQTYLEGIDKDSVLDLVLSSLPEETIFHGSDTMLQLNHQFDTLKGTLRHFSLIPPGGGGILAHSLARVASWLKIKEGGHSGDGIESIISRVESYLAEGKLAEAADALDEGLQGSQAAEIVRVWVRQARNRAIAEQALTLLQSFATSVSLT
ncbi:MICOS complex subunit MIC60, mitochondrial isoform X1 [Syzygium oleosum]|uniref:MICOS complex subunit MIC60, mitochondrial isoform X1 n=1 Tax=Syzygium oleosum TaxID=219896 RepID=UPI0024B979BD|nr:MICOS complex subunit MIC60, mitochondrial isoform X1 [Syzygium oleosum]